jgi:hypothetical protein
MGSKFQKNIRRTGKEIRSEMIEIIRFIWENQPVWASEIIDYLRNTDRPNSYESSRYARLSELEESCLIKVVEKEGASKKYALWYYAGLEPAFRKLKQANYNKVSWSNLGLLSGVDPAENRSRVIELSNKYEIRLVPDSESDPNILSHLRLPSLRDMFR